MKRLIGLLIGTSLAVVAVQPTLAALPTPASGSVWDANQRVEYRWKEGSEPPAWAKSAMNAAAADSTSSRKSKAAIFSYDSGASSWLGYTDGIPTNWAIGYTVRATPSSFTLRVRPHGTALDWGTLRWCQFFDGDAPNNCYDLEMVTLHEFGHAQTLDHVDEAEVDTYTDSVMHTVGLRNKPKTGWNQHVFGRCDVARLQIRYEPLTTATPISTCLDLPTDLSLAPASSTVGSGAAVTLAVKLKIGADAIYPNLASEPLSDRSVLLQRRAVGGSSWTTIGEMSSVTDDTGRYVKTITLASTYDWRAVFSGPGDEGLDGSTSNVSRLTVSVSGGCAPGRGSARDFDLFQTC